jgi:putative ABC transport system ATP-binding protein
MSSNESAIKISNLVKTFDRGLIRALNGVNIEIASGEFVAIVGPSGCGKSTLLHLIAALDHPDRGSVEIRGVDLFSRHDLNRYRAREIGLVFQLDNLLPTLTASENVQVPMFEVGLSAKRRLERARSLLTLVDLSGKDRRRPSELSGGERQRIAIARALANEPQILLADEPTGRLDSGSGLRVLELLEKLRRDRGLTLVVVTHESAVAERADRIIHMLDGCIVSPESVIDPEHNKVVRSPVSEP